MRSGSLHTDRALTFVMTVKSPNFRMQGNILAHTGCFGKGAEMMFEIVFDDDGKELYLLVWEKHLSRPLVIKEKHFEDLFKVLTLSKRRSDEKGGK